MNEKRTATVRPIDESDATGKVAEIFADIYDDAFANELMYGWLPTGTRRVPTADEVDAVFEG